MQIIIKTIPHRKQRYHDVGDWWFDISGDLYIRVSESGNWKYEALIALHETIEAILCKDRGIKEPVIGKFMVEDENNKSTSREAPNYKEHRFAIKIEKQIAKELKVDWDKYEKELEL